MGNIIHRSVVITYSEVLSFEAPDLDEFRAALPERFEDLLIGPLRSSVNDYMIVTFLPCGSKEGWPEDIRHIESCHQLIKLFENVTNFADESRPFTAVISEWYDDGTSFRVNKMY